MAILLKSLRRIAAQSFLNSILNKTGRMYFFFAQPNEFDEEAPTEDDTVEYENGTKSAIFALKEVLPFDASFVVPRVNYQPNISYTPYNSKEKEGDYVYNQNNFSVYICTKAGSNVSTVQPSQTDLDPLTLSDGYEWRYIYTIPLAMRDRFLTSDWIPVTNVLTESFFSNGGIESVSILDSGEGYQAGSTSIVVVGESNRGHGALIEPVIDEGKIVSVIVHEAGYGYVSPTLIVTSPTATRQAVLSASFTKGDIRSSQALIQAYSVPGTIESVELISGGSGYTNATNISLVGDGSGAEISFNRNTTTGEITDIQIINRGQGYSWAKLVISDTPTVGGSGAEARLNLSPANGFGRNPVKDLGARSIMVYHNLSREVLSGIQLENQIRQYGIISAPKSTDNAVYLKDQVTKTNFTSSVPFSDVGLYPAGTILYNEFPLTSTTKSFVVDSQIISNQSAGIRIRALNLNDRIVSGATYYKNETTFFEASFDEYSMSIDKPFVSACYTIRVESPLSFDINTFTVGKVLKLGDKRFVVVGSSASTMLLSSIDGSKLQVGDELVDDSANTLTVDSVELPIYDKTTGDIITIEKPNSPLTFGPAQSVSFRTIIEF
jgi:hypothetical protein